VSAIFDSEKLRVLFSEDPNFLMEFTMPESLPKVDTTPIDGVAQRFTSKLAFLSKDLSEFKAFLRSVVQVKVVF
jgi:hypothetical protein